MTNAGEADAGRSSVLQPDRARVPSFAVTRRESPPRLKRGMPDGDWERDRDEEAELDDEEMDADNGASMADADAGPSSEQADPDADVEWL